MTQYKDISPLPWECTDYGFVWSRKNTPEAYAVFVFDKERLKDKANSAYIVEACNAYQSLKQENERLSNTLCTEETEHRKTLDVLVKCEQENERLKSTLNGCDGCIFFKQAGDDVMQNFKLQREIEQLNEMLSNYKKWVFLILLESGGSIEIHDNTIVKMDFSKCEIVERRIDANLSTKYFAYIKAGD